MNSTLTSRKWKLLGVFVYSSLPSSGPLLEIPFFFIVKGHETQKSRELTSGSGSKPCWYNTGQLFNLVTLLVQQMSLSLETHI